VVGSGTTGSLFVQAVPVGIVVDPIVTAFVVLAVTVIISSAHAYKIYLETEPAAGNGMLNILQAEFAANVAVTLYVT